MNKDSKLTTEYPELLSTFFELLDKHKSCFNQQRVFERVRSLVIAELFTFGRHTITQLIMSLGLVSEDWSSWYRLFSQERFNEEDVNRIIVRECLSELGTEPLVVGFDGFHVPRSSHKMPGTNWAKPINTARFKPGIERAQRFLNLSWLTPMVSGFSRAIPLRCLPIFPEKAVASRFAPRKEWEGARDGLGWLRQEMERSGQADRYLFALGDASFDHLELWPALPANTGMMVRTKRNRVLFELPPPPTGKRGRPCSYGAQLSPPHQLLNQRKEFKTDTISIRSHKRTIRYRLVGPVLRDELPDHPLFLLIIGGGKRPKQSRKERYKPDYFLISARFNGESWQLPLPLSQLLAWIWQRWELEVAHRNLKTTLGLGDKQCWNINAAVSAVQWSAWVYALMLLSGHRAWGLNRGGAPPGRWRKAPKRWSFNTLWRGFRAAFWQNAEFKASCLLSHDNWPKKEFFFEKLSNSVLAASRG